jgi:hypothetical protein
MSESLKPSTQSNEGKMFCKKPRSEINELLNLMPVQSQHKSFAIGEVPVEGADTDPGRLSGRGVDAPACEKLVVRCIY